MSTDRQTMHELIRTSPMGKDRPFIGRCVLCGKENVSFADFLAEECPNPNDVTVEESIIDAIEREDKS